MTGLPAVDARLRTTRGRFRLGLDLHIDPGEVVALLGPNGAGKTTALRALAGLDPLTDGHIRFGTTGIDEPAAGAWVPPENRRVGVMFSDYLLFPHLNAADNIGFGLRRHGTTRHRAREQAAQWLSHMGIATLANRKPHQLSGGQAQRVALARALAISPDLLLLDEPLAALDAGTRVDTRTALQKYLAEYAGATVLVTHDPLDALVLADRLVIIENGHLVQSGIPSEITAAPRTEYVAKLVGLNLLHGHADGTTVDVDGFVMTTPDANHGKVFLAFRPAAVELSRDLVDSPNTWRTVVSGFARHGDSLRIDLDGPMPISVDVTPTQAARLDLRAGQTISATLDPVNIACYPR